MPVHFIGIMSGSSLDGLDMAHCSIAEVDGDINWSLNHYTTIPFPSSMENKLAEAPTLSGLDLMQLDADFGIFIGHEIKNWLDQNQLTADYIASHGHTVFHEPALGFTTQIGSGSHIAFETEIDTITNFRSADVAAGGQGAPFAPVADAILFAGYDAYLNLGGIANVNIISKNDQRKAWDIGPCNQALNFLAKKLNKDFDRDGEIASTGLVNQEIVDHLVSMFPFENGNPKGLSNEAIKNSWKKFLDTSDEMVADLMASVVEAIAHLIHTHISPLISNEANVLVTGGGAHNAYLMQRIKNINTEKSIQFHLPSKEIIDYKECALMAYLGYLTIMGRSYEIKEITGATDNTIGGTLHKAM